MTGTLTDDFEDRWPAARLFHLPAHASWLNQSRSSSPSSSESPHPDAVTDLSDLAARLPAFQDQYQQTAASFE